MGKQETRGWVERSEYIQEWPSSERKCQTPKVLTPTNIGELSANQSERKGNVHIVLPDKQEAYLKDIYNRMLKEAEHCTSISQWCIRFGALGNLFCTICGFLDKRICQYLPNGDKQHLPLSRRYWWATNWFLENHRIWGQFEASVSVWEVDNDDKMVLTKMARS